MKAKVDEFLPQAVLTLRKALDGGPLAIFVDPLLADPFSETEVYQAAIASGRVSLVKLPKIHPDIDPARTPYLMYIPDEVVDERLVNESLEMALLEALGGFGPERRGRSICGWVCGTPNPQVLAFRLASIAKVIRPSGQPWPLRYWDPRVIWHLPRALGISKWNNLQNGLGAWWTFGPTRVLQKFGTDVPHASRAVGDNLRFDPREWCRLERIETINKIFALSSEWDGVVDEQCAAQIDGLLARCETWGYPTEQDKMIFAVCGLTCRPDFDLHPEINEALREGSQKALSLQASLAKFDDTDWDRVSRGTWLPVQATT